MKNKKCPVCNIDYVFISEKRRLGCSFCYFAFRREMHYVFKSSQNNSFKHCGKKPKRYVDPVKLFVGNLIIEKVDDKKTRDELKKTIGIKKN